MGRFIRNLFVGFLLTIVVVVVLDVLLVKVLAQESQRVYPARLGEQNRRIETEQGRYDDADFIAELNAISITQSTTSTTTMDCEERNLMLRYMLEDIARYISEHPETAHVFAGAINTIHSTWCKG